MPARIDGTYWRVEGSPLDAPASPAGFAVNAGELPLTEPAGGGTPGALGSAAGSLHVAGTANGLRGAASLGGVTGTVQITGTPGALKGAARSGSVTGAVYTTGTAGGLRGAAKLNGAAGSVYTAGTPGMLQGAADFSSAAGGVWAAGVPGTLGGAALISGMTGGVWIEGEAGALVGLAGHSAPGEARADLQAWGVYAFERTAGAIGREAGAWLTTGEQRADAVAAERTARVTMREEPL